LPDRAREVLLLSVPASTRLLLEAVITEMEFILFNAELVACNTRKRLLEGLQETPVTFLFSSVETGYCIKITCFIIKVLKKVSKVK